jgi:hypothetical protein
MLGAAVQHAGNGWLFTAPGGGWEFPAFLAAALLVQAGLGAGAWPLRSVSRDGPEAFGSRRPGAGE